MAIFGNSQTSNRGTEDFLRQLSSQFLYGRVLDINQTTTLFNGNITVEIMGVKSSPEKSTVVNAKPFFPNIKNYPLTNEVVFLIAGPSAKYSENSGGVAYYYLTALNLWGNVNTNPTPNPYQDTATPSTNKSLDQIEAGSPNQSTPTPTSNFKPGTYFTEKANIFPLYPFEGDVIVEGRFGNSLRFGSTDTTTPSKYSDEKTIESYGAEQTFISGETKISKELISSLQKLNSTVSYFANRFPQYTTKIIIIGGESLVPNQRNLFQGKLAELRATNLETALASYPYLKGDISIQTQVGSTPYDINTDNPEDPKYTAEQFVKIQVTLAGTKKVLNQQDVISLNPWSSGSTNGDPITILRNGQPNIPFNAQRLTVEDINQDLASVWMTSTQQIPINVASVNDYASYEPDMAPTLPNQYKGNQVILNSGRLVLNSKTDHLLLSSNKSINLNAQESVNVDVTGDFIVQAGQILLGSKDASESVLLGDSTINLLQQILQDQKTLLDVLSGQVGVPTGTLLAPTATIAALVSSNLSGYIAQLDGLKSDYVKVE